MLDWIAGAFELSGSYTVGNKKKIGFILNLIGCLMWIIVDFISGIYGLLLVVVPAFFVNIRNFKKWSKNKKIKRKKLLIEV